MAKWPNWVRNEKWNISYLHMVILKTFQNNMINLILVLERGEYETHPDQLENRVGNTKDLSSKKYKETFENTGDKPWVFTPSFGGSSNCWWGCTPRMLPNDFKLRSKYGVGIDWPIAYNELEQYYCEVERIMRAYKAHLLRDI